MFHPYAGGRRLSPFERHEGQVRIFLSDMIVATPWRASGKSLVAARILTVSCAEQPMFDCMRRGWHVPVVDLGYTLAVRGSV